MWRLRDNSPVSAGYSSELQEQQIASDREGGHSSASPELGVGWATVVDFCPDVPYFSQMLHLKPPHQCPLATAASGSWL